MVQETVAPPQKIFKSESLKIAISSTRKPITVSKGFPKIDRYFLYFDKNSVVVSCNIFS